MLQQPEFNLGDNPPAASLGKDELHCEGRLHHLQPFGGKKATLPPLEAATAFEVRYASSLQ